MDLFVLSCVCLVCVCVLCIHTVSDDKWRRFTSSVGPLGDIIAQLILGVVPSHNGPGTGPWYTTLLLHAIYCCQIYELGRHLTQHTFYMWKELILLFISVVWTNSRKVQRRANAMWRRQILVSLSEANVLTRENVDWSLRPYREFGENIS